MNNTPDPQNEDEISLVDFFAVLLRYRKMICTIMLCAIFVIIVGYFVYLSWQTSKFIIEKTYETRTSISLTPGAQYFLFNNSMYGQSFASYFIYPQVIHDVLKETYKISPQSNEVLQWIPAQGVPSGYQIFYESVNKKLLIKENTRSNVLEIICKEDDPQSGVIFLQSLFSHGSMALESYIKPLSKVFIDTYESASLPVAENDYYIMIKALAEGKTNIVMQLFEPYVLEQETETKSGRKYSTLALVIVFAAFFLSMFLPFCINALKNIRNDQETMRKLRAALGKDDTDK